MRIVACAYTAHNINSCINVHVLGAISRGVVIVKQSSQPSVQLEFSDQYDPIVSHVLAKHLMDRG
jgi:hypothetical protein